MRQPSSSRRVTEAAGVSRTQTGVARVAIDGSAARAAEDVLRRKKVGIFIVAFQAERFIGSVLERIPAQLRDLFAEILVIDDSSSDLTFETALAAGTELGFNNVTVLRTPFNRGYGGNQKLGYLHAIKHDFDFVILLDGDGQYAPEYLAQIVQALGEDDPDAWIASRMINRFDALRGGMPFYKWVGNQVLTTIENRMLGSDLSEFHSGYRAYKVDALRAIPFESNSDDFHFDTEVLIELLATGANHQATAVPTFYGDEISRVNGIKYAVNCLKAVSKLRLGQAGVLRSRSSTSASSTRPATRSRRRRTHCTTRSSPATGRLTGRSRISARAAEFSARSSRSRSRMSPPPTQSGHRTPGTPRRSHSTSTPTSTRRLDADAARLRADARRDRTSRASGGRRAKGRGDPQTGGNLDASTGNIAFLLTRVRA